MRFELSFEISSQLAAQPFQQSPMRGGRRRPAPRSSVPGVRFQSTVYPLVRRERAIGYSARLMATPNSRSCGLFDLKNAN